MEIEKESLKPLETLNLILRITLIALTVVTIVAIVTGLFEYSAFSNLPAGTRIEETFILAELISGLVGLVQTLLLFATMIPFAMWLYRVTFNLGQQSNRNMEFTPGWMIGWYFIPFANLIKPFRGMRELWQVSHKRWDADPNLLRWWWGFWLFSNSTGRGASRLLLNAETTRDYMNSTVAYIVSDSLSVGLNLTALAILTAIWTAYKANYLDFAEAEDSVNNLKIMEKAKNL